MTATHRLLTIFITLTTLTQAYALNATLERCNESPGIYYERLGDAQLYNTEWKVTAYVDLDDAERNLDTVRKYVQMVTDFSKSHKHTF
jgi:hypothetical protein